ALEHTNINVFSFLSTNIKFVIVLHTPGLVVGGSVPRIMKSINSEDDDPVGKLAGSSSIHGYSSSVQDTNPQRFVAKSKGKSKAA
ncbi:hypothetical protein C0992_011478, partial [Termitomyces sp. T32_za158]